MTFYSATARALRPAVCLTALLSSTAVHAEVTAQQVWDDWKANMGMYGASGVTIGSEVTEGGVVTITDFAIDFSDETTSMSANLGSLVLTEQGDGTVAVTMSEQYPFTVIGTTDGVETAMTISINQTGMTMIVSGTPEEMTYEISAPAYGVALTDMMQDGAALPVTASMTFNNMSGSYVSTPGDLRTIDYAVMAESADLVVNVNDPETGMTVDFSGKLNELATTALMTIPPLDTASEDIFAAGMALTGGYTFGATSFVFNAVDPAMGDASGTMTAMGGTMDFSFDKDVMGYDSSLSGLNVEFAAPTMPFPVKLSLAEYGLGILFPLSQTEEPADWAAYVNLTDLTVNDEIWMMIDAGNQLPHDPATVVMDLTGTATMFANILDPEAQAAAAEGAAPGEMNSLDINDITVRIGGAEVLATGALTFDNTDTTTIPGMPRPEGTIEVELNGINNLLDKLVSMGLLPEDQAMMPRMMMGMFATVVGEDQLTSKIEFAPGGGIFANGQQIQ